MTSQDGFQVSLGKLVEQGCLLIKERTYEKSNLKARRDWQVSCLGMAEFPVHIQVEMGFQVTAPESHVDELWSAHRSSRTTG